MPLRVFIGSASESLSIAREAERVLASRGYIVACWDKAFSPSVVILTELARYASDSDFGIFVFSPDDIVISRHKKDTSVRDNVIFEAGIFIGALGPSRTFMLSPGSGQSKLRVPSDLGGVVLATYSAARRRGNSGVYEALVGIDQRMRALGPAQRNPYNELNALRERLREALIECTDGLISVLEIIEPVARRHTRTWSVLSLPVLVMTPLEETYDKDILNQVYWWLVVEGVFKFKDIEQFTSEEGWDWDDSIEFVEMSSRGAAFLNLLRFERSRRFERSAL